MKIFSILIDSNNGIIDYEGDGVNIPIGAGVDSLRELFIENDVLNNILASVYASREYSSRAWLSESSPVDVKISITRAGNVLLEVFKIVSNIAGEMSDLYMTGTEVFFELTRDGTILELSPSVYNLFGIKRGDLLGRNILEFYDNKEDRTQYIAALTEKGKVEGYAINLRHPGNFVIPGLITARIVTDQDGKPRYIRGILRVNRVLGHIKRQIARRSETRLLESIFENNSIPIIISDPVTGEIIDANPAACKFYRGNHFDFLTTSLFDIIDQPETEIRARMDSDKIGSGKSRFRHKLFDGEKREVEVFSSPISMTGGEYIMSFISDVTEIVDAEKMLSLSSDRYKSIVMTLAEGLLEITENLTITYANPSAGTILDVDERRIVGKNLLEYLSHIVDGSGKPLKEDLLKNLLKAGTLKGRTIGIKTKSGLTWLSVNLNPVKSDRDGDNILVSFTDITNLISVQDNLSKRSKAIEQAQDGMAILDNQGKYLYLNMSHAQIYGYESPAELIGRSWRELYEEQELERFDNRIMPEVFSSGKWSGEAIGRKKDGSTFAQEISLSVLDDGGIICIVRDITYRFNRDKMLQDRLRFEEVLSSVSRILLQTEENAIVKSLMEVLPLSGADRIYIFQNHHDQNGNLLSTQTHEVCREGIESQLNNPELSNFPMSEVPRWKRALSQGDPIMGLIRDFPPEEKAFLEPQGIISILVLPIFTFRGWIGFIGFDVTSEERIWQDEDIALLSALADITGSHIDRRNREKALQHEKMHLQWSEANLEEAQSIAHLGSWEMNKKAEQIYWSPELFRIFGYSPDEIVPTRQAAMDRIHPDDVEMVKHRASEAFRENRQYSIEHRIITKSGEVRYVRSQGKVIPERDVSVGSYLDITAQKKAEIERNRLEKQLIQAQKLESIGHLAGGMAHDFNNLLTPMIGYADLLLADDKLRHRQEVEHIKNSAERAKKLTWQLMAFGKKQIISLRPLNLIDVIDNFAEMYGRTIRDDIELRIKMLEDYIHVIADKVQLEQVLINLSLNSQEAMPKGGRIIISADLVPRHEVPAKADPTIAQYAHILFSDNGNGIDINVLDHIFEPFFTTKNEFQSTGLGLSTVYGIVRQHGGFVTAKSQAGKGTDIEIYLPSPEPDERKSPLKSKSTATVMVVEDDSMVRDMVCAMLKKLGCKVESYTDPESAIMTVDRDYPPPDILLTDVIMPGIDGKMLYEKLSEKWHNLEVLYMSGYTDNIIAQHGVLEEGVNFLQKPFGIKELKERLGEKQ